MGIALQDACPGPPLTADTVGGTPFCDVPGVPPDGPGRVAGPGHRFPAGTIGRGVEPSGTFPADAVQGLRRLGRRVQQT